VILTVIDDEDTPASDSALALIASGTAPPVADTGGPYEGSAGVPVYFDGTDSRDPDGGKLRYAWDFGDDTKASGATPTHTYAVNGTFDVTLRVIDDSARADTDDTSVVIQSESAADQIRDLIEQVEGLGLHKGTENSLTATLENALKKLEDGNANNDRAATNNMRAFINKVEAQEGKKIPRRDAEELIEAAEEIIDSIENGGVLYATASSATNSSVGASALSPSVVLLLAGLGLVRNRRRYSL
jgi:PKD repeat protein